MIRVARVASDVVSAGDKRVAVVGTRSALVNVGTGGAAAAVSIVTLARVAASIVDTDGIDVTVVNVRAAFVYIDTT